MLLAINGLRDDGRRPEDIRRLHCSFGSSSGGNNAGTSGFCRLTQGLTVVTATVVGPRETSHAKEMVHDECLFKCNVSFAPFAGTERRIRKSTHKKCRMLANVVESTFGGVIFSKLYPLSEIVVNLVVEEMDGSVLASLINATTIALMNAGICLKDFVTACSVGYVDKILCLDVNYNEQRDGTCLVVATTTKAFHCVDSATNVSGDSKDNHDSRLLLVKTINNSSYSKSNRLSEESLMEMTTQGSVGCMKICRKLQAFLVDYTQSRQVKKTSTRKSDAISLPS